MITSPCPHCHAEKPSTLWLCRACHRELPWEHKVAVWDTSSKHRTEPRATSEPVPVRLAKAAALGWLKLHSSAVL